MLNGNLLELLLWLSLALVLIVTAQKIGVAYPIVLVLGGLAISFIPGLPIVNIQPDVVFLVILPPLLYDAAWKTSWNDFWKWKRPVSLLAFGLVIFTSVFVAYFSAWLIPGFTLATGFLLGGIISPPDAVAATTVLSRVPLPKRILTILEGESLVNDASGLIIFRFALATVLTGRFSANEAIIDFFLVTIMGIICGMGVASVIYLIQRYLPSSASVSSAFTLLAPYFMYLAAEHFGYSGVMAVISGGLFLSYYSHNVLRDGQSRLQFLNVWATLILILNALVFILIGLELPVIVKGMAGYSLLTACSYGISISLLVAVLRLVLVFPATFIPRWFSRSIREKEPAPGWKSPLIIGWAGMRGVVSLAAALSLPLLIPGGNIYQIRNLIILITFVVILTTLVLQGISLPFLILAIDLREFDVETPENLQEAHLRIAMIQVALDRLDSHYAAELEGNSLLNAYRIELLNSIGQHRLALHCLECGVENTQLTFFRSALKDISRLQRKELFDLRRKRKFSDQLIRREEIQIDLTEVKIRHRAR